MKTKLLPAYFSEFIRLKLQFAPNTTNVIMEIVLGIWISSKHTTKVHSWRFFLPQ
jgi:hypothetical protein